VPYHDWQLTTKIDKKNIELQLFSFCTAVSVFYRERIITLFKDYKLCIQRYLNTMWNGVKWCHKCLATLPESTALCMHTSTQNSLTFQRVPNVSTGLSWWWGESPDRHWWCWDCEMVASHSTEYGERNRMFLINTVSSGNDRQHLLHAPSTKQVQHHCPSRNLLLPNHPSSAPLPSHLSVIHL